MAGSPFSQASPAAPAAPSPLNPGWSPASNQQASSSSQQPGVQRSTSAGSYSTDESSEPRRSGGAAGEYAGAGGGAPLLEGLARGDIGSAYGPYSYQHAGLPNSHSGQPLLNGAGQPSHSPSARFSTALSESSLASYSPSSHQASAQRHSLLAHSPSSLAWDEKDPEMDDEIHRTDAVGSKGWKRTIGGTAGNGKWAWSTRGFFNVLTLAVLIGALLALFAGYPIITYYRDHRGNGLTGSFNLGGINGSGQVPDIPNLPQMIDRDTPDNVKSRTGFDGKAYNLIFSDEFETEGRTFWPGDDPFWEAVDFHYWPTADYEWYSPRAAVTRAGSLVLTQTERESHDLNFESAMLQTWNKFCFTRGYVEVSISLPGNNLVGGYWPGAWLMGNLGRPGYGATTEGTWPYSYTACDVGTFPNQTFANGSGPEAALTTGYNGGSLSYLPGQRLSACTCPGQDHPGPNVRVGRGAPEIDIIEAQVDVDNELGQVSQSFQIAPFDDGWHSNRDEAVVYDSDILKWNSYEGGPFQQAASGLAYISTDQAYDGNFEQYGLEYWGNVDDDTDGYITWQVGGVPTWKMLPGMVGPNAATGISQRPIPVEPMTIILNFGMSDGFQKVDFANLKWPAEMLIDYVRVYQIEGEENWGCDPDDYPTADYIDAHPEAYQNANATIWSDAGFDWPRNSLYDGC